MVLIEMGKEQIIALIDECSGKVLGAIHFSNRKFKLYDEKGEFIEEVDSSWTLGQIEEYLINRKVSGYIR